MFLGHGNCPAEAALTDLKIMLLDVVTRLGEQPLAKVPQTFVDSSPQFLDRDFVQVGGARGSFEFHDQLGCELFGMTFNQSY